MAIRKEGDKIIIDGYEGKFMSLEDAQKSYKKQKEEKQKKEKEEKEK